ncbi:MAG: cold shock domain-containing protein [candidate division WOR-3 bacterium]|nr:cold shock domain-containing protein [candidate division WOR-3 bacterium]MDW8150690.1 cold shock domain-containing protein [candidate division WOR-3 bacterium]
MKGKVKWFNPKKGYGFIDSEDGKSIFVHYTSIQSNEYRTLNEGDEVTFEIENTEKGPKAINVVITRKALRREKNNRRNY